MDPVSLQHIVQAGAVGISIALIFLIWKIYEKCASTTDKVVEVVGKNAEAMTQLKDSIDKNSNATDRMSGSLVDMNAVARDAMSLKKKLKRK